MIRRIALMMVSLVPLNSAPQFPPPPTAPPLPLLCNAVSQWRVRLTAMTVEKTPSDGPGSHEEWEQNFILMGNGPFASSSPMQAKTFEAFPLDDSEIPFPVNVTDVGTMSFSNSRSEDRVVFSGKERDPFFDDRLPRAELKITNPCKVSGAGPLTAALNLELPAVVASGEHRKARYVVLITPL
jgi:hypothetical protein